MQEFINNETNEKVNAVRWLGETQVFREWQEKWGQFLPFSYHEFPKLRIQNTSSNLEGVSIVNHGGWVVRTRDGHFLGFTDSIFTKRYSLINAQENVPLKN